MDQQMHDERANPHRIVSVSGGKDSTALYLTAMERHGADGFEAVFADVGNEHEWTLDFVRTLPERTGAPPVRWVRADFSDKFERKRRTVAEKWPRDGVPDAVVRRALEVLHPTGNHSWT